MPGRSNRSGRVVIMDDIAWSEPAPRGRRTAAALDPPSWVHQTVDAPFEYEERVEDRYDDRRSGDTRSRDRAGFRAEDYLGEQDYAGYSQDGWQSATVDDADVIDYTDAVDEEDLWGPRPKLLSSEPGGKRTVVITGRVADRHHLVPRADSSREDRGGLVRHGFHADRTAMWAVLLCVIVLLAAVASH